MQTPNGVAIHEAGHAVNLVGQAEENRCQRPGRSNFSSVSRSKVRVLEGALPKATTQNELWLVFVDGPAAVAKSHEATLD